MSQKKKIFFKVVIIGDSGSGKTSLLYRYFPHNWGIYATLGVNIENKKIESAKNKNISFSFWEIVGDPKKYDSVFFKKLYAGAKGIILIFDVGNTESFRNLSYWLNDINKYIDYEFAGILVGNKMDRADRKITYSQGQKFADKIGFEYIETSAKTNINVKEAFQYIIEEILHPKKEKINEIVKRIKYIESLLKEKSLKLEDYQHLKKELDDLSEKLEKIS